MIRLFKHYIPHSVLLLGLIDLVLLMVAGDFAWRLRADQLGMTVGGMSERLDPLVAFTGGMLFAAELYSERAVQAFAAGLPSSYLRVRHPALPQAPKLA